MYTQNTGFTGEYSDPHKTENIKRLFTYLKVFNKPKNLELRTYLNLTNEPSEGA